MEGELLEGKKDSEQAKYVCVEFVCLFVCFCLSVKVKRNEKDFVEYMFSGSSVESNAVELNDGGLKLLRELNEDVFFLVWKMDQSPKFTCQRIPCKFYPKRSC